MLNAITSLYQYSLLINSLIMKHLSKSRCEFASERSELLLRNFRESLTIQSRISLKRAFHDAVNAPAPRFWVSEIRALRIVKAILNGDLEILDSMRAEKQRMYLEIARRVKDMKASNPEMNLGDIVFTVVNSPAPSFYMTADYARKLIVTAKKGKRI